MNDDDDDLDYDSDVQIGERIDMTDCTVKAVLFKDGGQPVPIDISDMFRSKPTDEPEPSQTWRDRPPML